MFGAAIIIFRESLEAALLIGIIAAATRGLARRDRWLLLGIGAGLAGSLLVAAATQTIAELADGAGQELFNAAVLGIAVVMIGWHNVWMASHGKEMAGKARQVGADVKSGRQELSAVAAVVALAVLREGSESVLFLQGMTAASNESGSAILAGGAFGLAAGAALGFIVYRGLLRIPLRWFFAATSTLLLLLAAGLASQMAKFLVQGDFLPSLAAPAWDTSALLTTDSALGTALHVLVGYDARPAGMQLLFYAIALVAIASATLWVRRRDGAALRLHAQH
ncbi:MAG: FTR1 family protein [Burkholderiaceae bacterium]